MTTVPVEAGEITPAWLIALLGPEGWPRVEAVRTDRLPGANPKVTQVYRAHLSFSARARSRPEKPSPSMGEDGYPLAGDEGAKPSSKLTFGIASAAPARTVIVKIPAEDPGHRSRHAANHVYEREIGLYRLLEAEQGASMARLHAAAYDAQTGMGAMVIEDLGPNAPSDGLVPPGSAGPVVEYLALLHAAWWESPGLAATAWLRGTENLDLWGDPPALYAPGWKRLSKRLSRYAPLPVPASREARVRSDGRAVETLDKVGGEGEAPTRTKGTKMVSERRDRLRRIGDTLVTRLPAVLAELERRPRTLVHADLHPGNLMWRPGSDVPVVIDWQGAAFAGGTSDLAKLLLHMRPEDLAGREQGLLRQYHGLLAGHGVAGYPFGRFERDYRLAQAAVFANYAIISPPARATDDLAIEASMGRSLLAVSAAIGAVFPDDFDWP